MASPCCAGRGVNSPLLGRRGAEACLGSCSQAQSLSPTATLCAVSPGPRAPGSWGVRSQALPSALEALVVPGLRYLCALPAARPSPSRAGVSDPPPGDELRGYSCPVTSPGPGLSPGAGDHSPQTPPSRSPSHSHTPTPVLSPLDIPCTHCPAPLATEHALPSLTHMHPQHALPRAHVPCCTLSLRSMFSRARGHAGVTHTTLASTPPRPRRAPSPSLIREPTHESTAPSADRHVHPRPQVHTFKPVGSP